MSSYRRDKGLNRFTAKATPHLFNINWKGKGNEKYLILLDIFSTSVWACILSLTKNDIDP